MTDIKWSRLNNRIFDPKNVLDPLYGFSISEPCNSALSRFPQKNFGVFLLSSSNSFEWHKIRVYLVAIFLPFTHGP